MKILIVTDAWEPQVNGVVRTLKQTRAELQKMGHTVELLTPLEFKTIPCPTYPDIRLSLFPGSKVNQRIGDFAPDAIHIATEGPLGLAARKYCLKHKLPYTTAYHSRFPEYVQLRFGIPLSWTYAWLARFHNSAQAVMAPTRVVVEDLEKRGIKNVVLWSRGVDLEVFKPGRRDKLTSRSPIFVYVGRVAVEKNVQAFLELDLPGSKWIVGDGPAAAGLKAQYGNMPNIHWLGVLNQAELAEVYSSADVFVFPSKTDTFGLVLLEAMACGCPVAAYPVTGPIDVIGTDGPGSLHEDLHEACMGALQLDRAEVRRFAERYSWGAASRQFASHLHPFTPHAQQELRLAEQGAGGE
ncbi:glycosyltransferase family 1 protein [Chitinibacter fontanus]|uniref:Glycosyltransferase family 1 protein n=1 Tax=Chitinibacter fontanus TaxID=1737446 RepID=A0A7D5Z304_9NEIS|nr:glycosyltransferase family 1 protein [Chitinibacter fontanus]QLI80443.1 glycosyltransferase family 1 protein [Chitinibacter fontanus]